ncbi:threonine/serine dehydratase [Nodosilinea sp. PGN35]|uniref:threonine/serine dehydratase n=1 Tax=Nodosilinea sp. PGN35 TaxID=3020489 RepID=UPI0023B33955|nr:threonine/serine dehydratase [Nodosilinea sp. TSF1-S3]MDF0369719.1 threonine/serine dehydratase [Nodosilinea sp. TSF1-S3]
MSQNHQVAIAVPSLETLVATISATEPTLRPYGVETPLELSIALSQLSQCQVLLKLENLQRTGSFKVRGALAKLLSLTPEQRHGGVVAASSGNHGAAVAYGLSQLGIAGQIWVPETVSPTKLAAIRRYGIPVQQVGNDALLTELAARCHAEETGATYVSPYNDVQVIAGQGSMGVEIARQLKDLDIDSLDAVFVAVGGGGLMSGTAAYLRSVYPKIHIVGCQPENSPVMARSVAAGHLVELESLPTLSDGTAGGIEAGAITFELCRALVDEFVLVSETEIIEAMRLFLTTQHQLLEGAAGVAIAAFLQQAQRFQGQTVAIAICGANISLPKLKSILP